jgi:hypothetical protein
MSEPWLTKRELARNDSAGGISRLRGRVDCDLQQPTLSQGRPNATAAPGSGFGELPECLACVLMALPAASERFVRLIEFRAELRDGSAQEFELGALLIAQFGAPIPTLTGLSHRPLFAVRRHAPARLTPAWPHIAHPAEPGQERESGALRRRAVKPSYAKTSRAAPANTD